MRKKIFTFFLFLLIISTNIVFGNGNNKTKITRTDHAKQNTKTDAKLSTDRIKRSLYDDEDKASWMHKGNKLTASHQKQYMTRQDADGDNYKLLQQFENSVKKEPPFWGNRGRRSGPSMEQSDTEYPTQLTNDHQFLNSYCKSCRASEMYPKYNDGFSIERRLELPFWGNRGRRSLKETDEPFWANRGRRQDNQNEPFWGSRGRREDEEPFWGNRGRREEEEPFWGNRGRREDTPFWGNRGRRDTIEPFWGSRGRREEAEPFWGNRGRREDTEPFWGSRGRRKQDLNYTISNIIDDMQGNMDDLARLGRSNIKSSFWANRARDSKLEHMFNDPSRIRFQHVPHIAKNIDFSANSKSEPSTIYDNRMYAEEPHYILVDRSSRSSAEDDPYYISRGKKYYLDISKAARGRRGAIEEIVKSVRNDPYYIARGKKDSQNVKIGNSTASHEEFVKAKELVCSTIELVLIKNESNKSKREVSDNDRDRRTILKKLAAQLQMDPYFVSRGKKRADGNLSEDYLEDFISDVAAKCD